MSWGYVGAAAVVTVGGIVAGNQAASAAEKGGRAQQAGIDAGIAEQQRASAEGQTFLAPFGEIGQQGIDQAGFLTDPQAQFDFLQSNPLFKLALENANVRTEKMAAARGRLSAGDTLQQLSQNVLLASQPLIAGQKSSIADLLNVGTGIATTQANVAIGEGSNVTDLLTSSGDVEAATAIAAGNAQAQQTQAVTQGIGTILPLLANS
jgi:hypothetical protein